MDCVNRNRKIVPAACQKYGVLQGRFASWCHPRFSLVPIYTVCAMTGASRRILLSRKAGFLSSAQRCLPLQCLYAYYDAAKRKVNPAKDHTCHGQARLPYRAPLRKSIRHPRVILHKKRNSPIHVSAQYFSACCPKTGQHILAWQAIRVFSGLNHCIDRLHCR